MTDWRLSVDVRIDYRRLGLDIDEVEEVVHRPDRVHPDYDNPGREFRYRGDLCVVVDVKRRVVLTISRTSSGPDARAYRPALEEKTPRERRSPDAQRTRRQRRRVHPAVAALGKALDGVRPDIRATVEKTIADRGYGRVEVISETEVRILD